MAIHEMEDGTLWVAIWGEGVCRIKGTESRTYNSANGLTSDWVRCLAPDGADGLWVGGADGIAHISGNEVRVFTAQTTPSIPHNSVRCVEVLHSGQLCFGMAEGGVLGLGGNPFVASPTAVAADEWVFAGYPDIPTRDGIDDIIEASDGSIWLALHGGELLQFAEGEWRRHNPDNGLTTSVTRLFEDRSGRIWGAGGDRLAEFSGNSWRVHENAVELPRALAESPEGELFVGTDYGIRLLDASGWHALAMGPDIGEPSVGVLLFGRVGTPWIGSGEGLIRGFRPVWTRYSMTAANIPLRSTPLYADPHFPPISADSDGNVVRFDSGQWQTISRVDDSRFRPKWFSDPRDGRLWALCENDALLIDIATGNVIEAAPLPSGAQTIRLKWGPDGAPWLFGNLGVQVLDGGNWRTLERHAETRESWAFDSDTASDGATYVCYESGIDVWKDGSVRPLRPFKESSRGAHYTAVCAMRDGTVWFGTYGNGIAIYDGQGFRFLTRDDGFVSNHVSQIREASDGTVWVAYRRKGMSSYKDGRWVNFGHGHGLPNAAGATIVEYPEGTIWLASDSKGIYRYVPDEQAPETTITAGADTIAARGSGVFSFAGIDAWHRTRPQDMAYSWRIVAEDGPETAWEPIQSASSAVVSGLPAGRYFFEVRAADEDRNVDPTPSSFALVIEPPFYARPEFVLPVGLLTGLVVISMVSLYVKQSRLKDSESSLRQSEAGLAEAQRIARVGNWEWNVKKNTMTCSPQVSRILGWPAIDRAPKVSAIRKTIHPDDIGPLDNAMQHALHTGAPLNFDHRIVLSDGEVRHIHHRGEAIKDGLTGEIRMRGTMQDITERKLVQADRERLIGELQTAIAQIKTLRGLIPICSSCKRIRDDSGYWNQLETFIRARSDAEFSHAICPDCAMKIYGVEGLMDDPEPDKVDP
jgi:PAS domain S-box-containing protein